MKKQGTWGGFLEIFITAQKYKINIKLHSDDENQRILFPCPSSSACSNTIYLYYKGNSHYQELVEVPVVSVSPVVAPVVSPAASPVVAPSSSPVVASQDIKYLNNLAKLMKVTYDDTPSYIKNLAGLNRAL